METNSEPGEYLDKPQVCSLPMRNGNYVGGGTYLSHPWRFVAYLWGMETFDGEPVNITEGKFVAYLWGMETLAFMLSFCDQASL